MHEVLDNAYRMLHRAVRLQVMGQEWYPGYLGPPTKVVEFCTKRWTQITSKKFGPPPLIKYGSHPLHHFLCVGILFEGPNEEILAVPIQQQYILLSLEVKQVDAHHLNQQLEVSSMSPASSLLLGGGFNAYDTSLTRLPDVLLQPIPVVLIFSQKVGISSS